MSPADSKPECEFCGAQWSDEMVRSLEAAMMGDCLLCGPSAQGPEDIVCHACKRVVLAATGAPAESSPQSHHHR